MKRGCDGDEEQDKVAMRAINEMDKDVIDQEVEGGYCWILLAAFLLFTKFVCIVSGDQVPGIRLRVTG